MRVRVISDNKDNSKNKCVHIITRDGVCITCKETILTLETRTCGECECFHEKPYANWPTCGKILKDVKSNTKIRYYIKDGTCFESKEVL